ncbi:N-acetyltransferase [soil metagenome]
MIAYRDARIADAAALAAMACDSFVETFGHLYPPEDLAMFLDKAFGPSGLPAQLGDSRYTIRLAIEDEGITGYAKIGPNAFAGHAHADAVELYQLYILKPWQGTGVAATLMDWAIAQARARSAPQLVLSVFVDNIRAQRFYARYGLREVGRYDYAVGNTIDDDRIWVLDL